jgi:hypothetical protein
MMKTLVVTITEINNTDCIRLPKLIGTLRSIQCIGTSGMDSPISPYLDIFQKHHLHLSFLPIPAIHILSEHRQASHLC